MTESRCRCSDLPNELSLVQICPAKPHASFASAEAVTNRNNAHNAAPRLQKNSGDVATNKKQKKKLLSLGSNQKPSGCLNLAVITAERATNCATEDIRADTLLDEDIAVSSEYNAYGQAMSMAIARVDMVERKAKEKQITQNTEHTGIPTAHDRTRAY